MASLVEQKGYVGFSLMPIYGDHALKKKLSPALLKLLKGKTCFHIKKLDALSTDPRESRHQHLRSAREWTVRRW